MKPNEMRAQVLMDMDLILLENVENIPDENTWNAAQNQKINSSYSK